MIVALLRFTHPSEISICPGRDFLVIGADIVVRAENMRDQYAAHLKNTTLNRGDRRQHTDRYRRFNRVSELHAHLTKACEEEKDVTLDGRDGYEFGSWFASDLIFMKQFVAVKCPACAREFLPESCQVISWAFGESLFAEGGRRLVCPMGHTLYSRFEWNS